MADEFYYEWLELSVEKFEYNAENLKSRIDEYVKKWNSNKNIKIQQRASVHENDLRTAAATEESWKKEYSRYKAYVDAEIIKRINIFPDSIPQDKVKIIAEKANVSENYVLEKAKNLGKSVGNAEAGKAKPAETNNYKLSDLEPKTKGKLEPIQKTVEELGYRDLLELLKNERSVSFSLKSTPKASFIESLTELKGSWDKKSSTNNQIAGKKSLISKVCSGFISFFKDNDISEYSKYLTYLSVRDVLDETRRNYKELGIEALDDVAFYKLVDSVFGYIGNRDNSMSLVKDYCNSKGIGYPVSSPKRAVCPFCSNSFDREEPIQKTCPSCLRSFIVKCPKCKKEKNIITDMTCDGIELQKYPIILRKYSEAEDAYNRLAIDRACDLLAEIETDWPGLPEAASLKAKNDSLKIKYGAKFAGIQANINANKFFAAKQLCDSIAVEYPQLKDSYAMVYAEVASAEKQFADYKKETSEEVKISLLLEIAGNVSDFDAVNAELKKFPLMNIDSIRADGNASGNVMISWQSQNKPNSVNYHIIRKAGSAPANISDGEELIVTQGLSYSDDNIKECTAFYYGVYAERGPLNAPLLTTKKATVFVGKVEASVNGGDGAVSVSWIPGNGEVKVYYSDNQLTESNYALATKVTNESSGGCNITGLTNGKDYFVAVVRTWQAPDGVICRSTADIHRVTPIEKIVPPRIRKRLGQNAGEYIITYENFQTESTGDLRFYYSQQAGAVAVNSTMNLAELQKKITQYNVLRINDKEYLLSMREGEHIVIYPVIVTGSAATVGNSLDFRHIKPISVAGATVSSGRLILQLSDWPEGAEAILTCYNYDTFPQDKADCEKRLPPVVKGTDKQQLIDIPNIGNEKYYISLFAQKGGEYIKVCDYFYTNETGCIIRYTFGSFLGRANVKLEMDRAGRRPELVVRAKKGFVPLTKTSGDVLVVIKAKEDASKCETVDLGRVEKDMYGKIFTDAPGYEIMAKGDGKIR